MRWPPLRSFPSYSRKYAVHYSRGHPVFISLLAHLGHMGASMGTLYDSSGIHFRAFVKG